MRIGTDAHNPEQPASTVAIHNEQRWSLLIDIAVIVLMAGLLLYGASWQIFKVHTDVSKYECYAVNFWYGKAALSRFPYQQCDFITHPSISFVTTAHIVEFMERNHFPAPLVSYVAAQDSARPFHALPHEYPLLTLIPFTLALIAVPHWYQVVFALLMALVAAAIYFMLLRYRTRGAAIAFAFYLVVGGWGTAEGRFDLIPSALTLLAVVYAVRMRWNWAFTWLALATVIKLYPLPLLMPFLLAQQMASRERWNSWKRLQPMGVFVAVCAIVVLASLLLSIEGTIGPLSYFENRPFQIESTATSLFWLAHFLGYSLKPVFTYGSLNALSPLSSVVSLLMNVFLLAGLAYTYWLQWRGKLDIAASTLLTLLIVMLTGKVFSPQYLIWVAPLVAYIGLSNYKWVLSWSVLSFFTSVIYPYLYTHSSSLITVPNNPLFYPIAALRNFLLLGFVLSLLWYYSRRPLPANTAIATNEAASIIAH